MPDVYLRHAVAIISGGVKTTYEKGLNSGLSDEVAGHFMIRGAMRPQLVASVTLPVANTAPDAAQPNLPLEPAPAGAQASDPPPANPVPPPEPPLAQDPPEEPKAEEPKVEEAPPPALAPAPKKK